jgi:hypothetical protein
VVELAREEHETTLLTLLVIFDNHLGKLNIDFMNLSRLLGKYLRLYVRAAVFGYLTARGMFRASPQRERRFPWLLGLMCNDIGLSRLRAARAYHSPSHWEKDQVLFDKHAVVGLKIGPLLRFRGHFLLQVLHTGLGYFAIYIARQYHLGVWNNAAIPYLVEVLLVCESEFEGLFQESIKEAQFL